MSYVLTLFCKSTKNARGGCDFGTQFDWSTGCAACGTGAIQIGALFLGAGVMPSKATAFETGDGEIVTQTGVASMLHRLDATIEVRDVVDPRKGTLEYKQVIPRHTMPPLCPTTEGITRERPCHLCDRDGYFTSHPGRPMILHYPRQLLSSTPGMAWTWERFGNSSLGTVTGTIRRQAPAHLLLREDLFEELSKLVGQAVYSMPVVFE